MIKYDRKFCLKYCPYRDKYNKKFLWKTYFTSNGLFFYVVTAKGINKPCIVNEDEVFFHSNKSKDVENYIKNEIDMERQAIYCPVRTEMILFNWIKKGKSNATCN